MSNGGDVPAIDSDEWLARYIYYSRHVRPDGTVRPDTFIPHPYPDLSVTRHLQLSEGELWQVGRVIARQTSKTLHGRADTQVFVFEKQQLRVVANPVLPDNPNHANVTGWPVDKPAQKIIAQQIATEASKVLLPPEI